MTQPAGSERANVLTPTPLTSHFWTAGDRGQSVRLLFSSAVLSPSSGPVSAEVTHCWLP